jgi:hypothetical protein
VTGAEGWERLAAAYRRLLLAYPPHYRRERGPELISTLLDAAPPDQQRPTWREAVDLIRGGLRCRFAIPHGLAGRVVAIAAAVVVGSGGTAAAAWAAWEVSDPVPDRAAAVAIGREMVGREPGEEPRTVDTPLNGYGYGTLLRDPLSVRVADDPGLAGYVQLAYAVSPAEVQGAVSRAHDELPDAGWRVVDTIAGVRAARDDVVVDVMDGTLPGERPVIVLRVHGVLPTAVPFASVAGLSAGLVAGWLGAGWLLRRYRAHAPSGRAAIALVGIPSLTVLTLLALGMVPGVVRLLIDGPGWSSSDALYPAAWWYGPTTVTVAGLLGLIGTATLAGRRVRRWVVSPAWRRRPRGTAGG